MFFWGEPVRRVSVFIDPTGKNATFCLQGVPPRCRVEVYNRFGKIIVSGALRADVRGEMNANAPLLEPYFHGEPLVVQCEPGGVVYSDSPAPCALLHTETR